MEEGVHDIVLENEREYIEQLKASPLYSPAEEMHVAMNLELLQLVFSLNFRSFDQFISWINSQPTCPKRIPQETYDTVKNLQISSKNKRKIKKTSQNIDKNLCNR